MAWADTGGGERGVVTFPPAGAGGSGAAEGREDFVHIRFAFPSPSSECPHLPIFLKFSNCLQRCPRQQLSAISEAQRRHKPGTEELKAELWEPGLAQHGALPKNLSCPTVSG